LRADAADRTAVFQLLRRSPVWIRLGGGAWWAMRELTAADFEAVWTAEAVRWHIDALEGERRAALRTSWTRLSLGLLALACAALFAALVGRGSEDMVLMVVAVLVLLSPLAIAPLQRLDDDLKRPILWEIANRAGMEYQAEGFTSPILESAGDILFSAGPDNWTLTDLFNGVDEEGRGFALHEARAVRGDRCRFAGQIYAIQRRPGAKGRLVVAPRGRIASTSSPSIDMDEVRIEGDEAFDSAFEVYASDPLEARLLLFDSSLRALLLELGETEKVYLYAGPEEALVAVAGSDRFEAHPFKGTVGEAMVRRTFDDVQAGLALLRNLKAKLG
jgi:hypothetical protein